MSRERCVGFVIVGEVVTVVDAEIPDDPDEPLTIISDDTWRLQNGERAPASSISVAPTISARMASAPSR
jgi:hypothetical protein